MRSGKSFHLILPCFIAMAAADPLPPSLVWTADPTTSSDPFNTPGSAASAVATDTGMSVSGTCIGGSNCFSSYEFVRTFTVTSGGTFVASASLTDSLDAFNCLPDSCFPTATVQGSFAVTGIFINLSDSGSAVNSSGSCGTFGCEVLLNLSDAESALVTLGVGNYGFVEEFTESAQGNGDATVNFSGSFNLVPTPEPRYGLAVALAFLIVLWRKARATAAELS